VHTARSHVVPAEGGEGPRAPGEYVFANRNSFGVSIARVVRAGPAARLVPVAEIDAPDLHDTFIQEDPIDKRTYLYLADGFGAGFRVFDVTDPENAVEKARWDLTPQCSEDWYSHTIDVAVRNGRRYVTLPAELFLLGESSDQEQAQGCNRVAGSGNVSGPMWIVDATDFSQLATDSDNEATLRAKSEQALVATWKNPAGRAGGNLTFSPHNQQIVDDKIYLSNYHGGVIVLDASAAFDGVDGTPAQERPREIAFKVPEVPEPRPIFGPVTNPLIPFFTAFPLGRPQVWDLVVYKGYILTQDMTGGLYSLCETDSGPCRTAGSAGSASTAGGGAQGATAAAAKRCSTPRGRLRPRNIGAARLGRTRAAQRKNFVRTARRRKLVDRFCLTDGRHIRVAYASRAAARSGARPRPRLAGKTILALTASRRYAIRGVKAGSSVAALRRRIGGLSRPYRLGPNRWHLAKGSSSRLVFRVRGGRVREIGVADLGVTSKRRSTRRLLRLVDTS